MADAFRGVNTQGQQQFAVSPFQKFELNLGNVNRAEGQFFPELEGDYLLIENTDAVFYITLTSPYTNIKQSFIARNGLQIDAAFKGVTIQHPNYTVSQIQELRASIVFGKGCARVTNQSATPIIGGIVPLLINANSPATLNLVVPLYPGQKFIREIYVTTPGTTITGAFYSIASATGAVSPGTSGPGAITGSFLNYSAFNNPVGAMDVVQPFTGQFIMRATNIPLPQQCNALFLFISGTGLAFVNNTFPPASSVKLVIE